MQTKHLSDETLDQTISQKVKSEREILTEILHLLKEADRRRLYSKYAFQSLLEYACKRHGYSEDQANRRISAARLLSDLPEIEEKIESGALTLTNLCKAQSVFRAERKAKCERSSNQKLELLSKIENVSKREAEKTLEQEALVVIPRKNHQISLDQFALEVQAKLKRLMDILAHTECGNDVNALVEKLADLGLEKWDPIKKAERAELRTAKASPSKEVHAEPKIDASVPAPAQVNQQSKFLREYVDAGMRRAVFRRDNFKCTNCKSSRALEVDHIIPVARGGTNELGNLRLLCRSCNQRHAIESYGLKKMNRYLKEPSILYSA